MDQKISADPLITSLDGTEYFPLIQDGVNVRMTVANLIAMSSSGQEITDSTSITRFTTNSNWNSAYGKTYTGTAITGHNEHDYLLGTDSVTGAYYKYVLLKISGALTPIRIPVLLA